MSNPKPLPPVAERFLRYVRINTQSDPDSGTTPSTACQKDLGRLLTEELSAMGALEVEMDEYGYVFATIPSTLSAEEASRAPVLALIAHLDTSPDAPGQDVQPVVHYDYDGGLLTLPGNPDVRLDPAERPALRQHIGHDLITSDGTTLLGSDDKAGVAILMQLAEDLLQEDRDDQEGPDAARPRPKIRLLFTVDEEIGQGVDKLSLDKLGADVAYTLDGSGTGTLSYETFNAAAAVVSVEGIGVHPGYAKGVMVNAVRVLAELIAALPAGEAPETTEGREGYIHPHTIAASDVTRAEARLILRDFTQEGMQRRKTYLEQLVATIRLKYPRASITLKIEDQYKNMRRYIEAVDLRAISLAHRAAERLGISLEDELVRGGTDGARLSEQGLPTPNVFNGGHDYHSCFEWNTVQNLELSLAYTKALVREWGEAKMNKQGVRGEAKE
ncbi:MAG: peptidase T [Rhodothermales bacterium]